MAVIKQQGVTAKSNTRDPAAGFRMQCSKGGAEGSSSSEVVVLANSKAAAEIDTDLLVLPFLRDLSTAA